MNGGAIGHRERRRHTGEFLRLDGVEFVVAAQHQGHRAVGAFDDQRLHRLFGGDAQQLAQLLDRLDAGRGNLLHCLGHGGARFAGRRRRGGFDVRRVVVIIAVGDGVFARIREDVEFL